MKTRLLVVELHHMGDALLSVPFVRGAAEDYEVHVLCRPASAGIYRLMNGAPQIHEWEPPWAEGLSCGPRQALAAACKESARFPVGEFSVAVCAWADVRAQRIMANAPRRIGFPMTRGNYYAPGSPWRRARLLFGRAYEVVRSLIGRPLLTEGLHRDSSNQPHLACWEQIARALGIRCDYSVPWVRAGEPPGEVAAFCADAHSRGELVVAFHGEARLPTKQWPRDRWRELIDSLPPGIRALEIVGPLAEPVGGSAVVRTPDLGCLTAVLAASDAVVCHDSLPAHLAAALGKPVVAIFGSGEPEWFAPWNNRDRVVQKRVCPLHPCIDRCGMDRPICLEHIGTEDVRRRLSALISSAT